MSLKDRFGAPLSTRSRAAAAGLDKATALMLGFYADPLAVIDQTLAVDPDFVMGRCFRAGLFLISSEKAALPEIAREYQVLTRLSAQANERERGHMAAIKAWLDGDFHGASERYGRVLFAYPRDLVALQFAHQCDFLLGQSTMLRDRVARVLPAWSEADVDYPYLLGMQAFGLEECGHYGRAEETGQRAVALQPRDTWGIHAVAHVYEMEGRLDDGIAWLTGRSDDWAPENMFAFHNWWHLALYHLERGETERVLALYDQRIRPARSEVALELVDAASLLWRLRLRGVEVGARWADLAGIYERTAEDAYYPFNDMHAMMCFVAEGRDESARRLVAALEAHAGDADSSGRLIRDVGLPVVKAIQAFGAGDYGTAVELLLDLRKRAQLFGGSHAQRDVLNLTLLEAALRAGDLGAARGLLNERLDAKPASPFAKAVQSRIAARARREVAA